MINAFTVRNWKHKVLRLPIEDSFSIGNNGFVAVSDGVTRDPTEELPTMNFLGVLIYSMYYPRPSPAKTVSNIFCSEIQNYLSNTSCIDYIDIKESFNYVNGKIKEFNELHFPAPDFLTHDLAGCVGSCSFHVHDAVYWGYITDCGVAIFDINGEEKWRTKSESPNNLESIIHRDPEIKNLNWKDPKMRKKTRTFYRNNADNPYSYGVLTGEKDALYYVRTGEERVNVSDFVLTYTDGIEPLLKYDKFSKILSQGDLAGLKDFCERNVKKEGTLVISNHIIDL